MSADHSDRLRAYRAKRSAERTPEPFGGEPGARRLFAVQHHAARREHYDLRLEVHGVLWSWAVPKGPSPDPGDKRLAVRVEDHPLDYAEFEGRIPEGNYGAGAVILWDRGVWIPEGDPDQGLARGKLVFELQGYKLRGRWSLVRARRDWLLVKERDAWAREGRAGAYPPGSILSGLTVRELAQGRDPAVPLARALCRLGAPRRRVRARRVKVMLAAPADAPFSREGWLFEMKYDGYRLIAAREEGAAVLLSRRGHELSRAFPEVARAVAALPFEHIVLDGEVVVHDERGLPSFARLQKRGRLTRAAAIRRAARAHPATLYVVDLLGFGDFDLRALALGERKRLLRRVLPSVGPLRYSEHVEGEGEALYRHVCQLGLEGMVAKDASAPYRGGRSRRWLKVKSEKTDDFVVVGVTEPKGSRRGFGALHVAQYVHGRLVYSGRVGSGFGAQALERAAAWLERLRREEAPCVLPEGIDTGTVAYWVAPELVCEVRFAERTGHGLLRAPVFARWREDKPPEACVREPALQHEAPEAEASPGAESGRGVPFTHLDKVFWPREGYTKGDLIEYYRAVSPWLLPYLEDRPVVLTRYPDGIDGKSFFQKDAPDFVPDWIRVERLWSEDARREIGYFVLEDVESLLYVVNLGTIPLHVWSSRIGSLERPDWCILDLDPKGAPFAHVIRIARAIRALGQEMGLPSFVKTSGRTGLHVLVPLGGRLTHQQSRTLGELLARVVVAELPDIATVARSLGRREGRVYIDYLQNGHGRLLVAPLSARPAAGAPVAMPLGWREVRRGLDPQRYTIRNAVKRLRALGGDPLSPVLRGASDITAALERLGERVGPR